MNIYLPSPLWRIFCYSIEKKIEKKYKLLHNHFYKDLKRRFMIDNNYFKFMRAALYLYRTSDISVRAGILMAPAEVYAAINATQQSFNDLIEILRLRGEERS